MIDYSSSPKIEIENVDTPLTLFGLRLNHLLVMLWLFLAPMPIFGIGVSAILLPVWYVFFKKIAKRENQKKPIYLDDRILKVLQDVYRFVPLSNLSEIARIGRAQRFYRE